MEKSLRICALFVLITCLGLPALRAQSYDKLWKQVEQAQKKSLPQTVIKLTGEIYRKAEKEKNASQMLKATVCRNTHQEGLTPDSFYVNLKNIELWAQSEQNPVSKSILHSLLAREYADYMQRNRRALLNRTILDIDEAPADVREWTIGQFVDKIDTHNRNSLHNSSHLLDASARSYEPFVVLEEGSRFYQHDMYHLLASRAIATYQQLHGFSVDTLMYSRIEATYQDMINAYRHRADSEDAVMLVLLNYWGWKLEDGIGREPYSTYQMRKEEASKEYLETLDDLIKNFGSREVCAEVYIKKASWLRAKRTDHSVAEALRVCGEGLKRYPSYKRINELKNIRESILQPQLSVTTENSGYPSDSIVLDVYFQNLAGFTLNLYTTTLSEVPWMDHGINKGTYRKYAKKLSTTHFDLQSLSSGKLPASTSYLPSDTTFKFRMPQETGVYILQVVPDAGTTDTADKFLVSTRFKVLTLNLGDGSTEITTLDAHTGQPVADATVSFYSSYSEQNRKTLAEVVTDVNGKAILPWQNGIRSYVARKGKDTAMMPQTAYVVRADKEKKEEDWKQVSLLTDRSLYRPGQTVYVKGIAYIQNSDSAHVLAGADYELVLLDANQKELSTQKVRTNDFGSFTTEFTLPAVCLNGTFSLRTNQQQSTTTFRVEEYKRPTFEITFTPVAEAYRLGERVLLKGNVKSLNGANVQNVPLSYTVTRHNFSRSSYWEARSNPLLADTIRLDANGDFAIPVTLDAPLQTNELYGNLYNYTIETTVTDEAGETQTASYDLSASSRAYSFAADLPQYVCKEDSLFFTFNVTNSVNVPQNIEGTYQLYPVERISRNRMLKAAQSPKQPILEGSFAANQRQDYAAWSKLPSGNYSLELSVGDSLGRKESNGDDNNSSFLLFSKNDKRPAAFADLFFYMENEEFDALHPASFLIGTSYSDVYMLMDVFCNHQRIESSTMQLNDTIIRMEFPYLEKYKEGVTILFNFVKDGEMHRKEVYLKKRKPERTLDMKWEVFRDRLRPGQEEEWKLIIKTPQGMPAAAEMLATMYDASLDKIYSENQLLRVFYPTNLHGVYRNASGSDTNYFSFRFPTKSWKVPAWLFSRFYSSYIDDIFRIAMVEDNAALREVIVGYGQTRNQLMGARRLSISSKESAQGTEQDNALEMSSDEIGDLVFEEELIPVAQPDLQQVEDLRTNFAETAFFYPQLRTNELGEIAFSFTMPHSLTRWNFHSYSHTKNMMIGMLDATTVTAKEFMLTPNMPRFVRVGDKTQIAANIANLTGKAVKGAATLTLFNPTTEKIISTQHQKFAIEAGKTAAVNFHFDVTDRYDLLGVRITADGGTFSDGEQHLLTVLSNKQYITETLAMPIRGGETRTFALDSLFNGDSHTATNRRLTVEFTGNPAWYAVQALPALSLPTTDNAISWGTAFYANHLAGYIANSQPRIKGVFDSWKMKGGTKETFLSELEKNQDVKNILLSESPWVVEANTEAEQKARIATLFDINQQNNRNLSALAKLKELQGEDGAWSWYEGMSGSRYITTYITELLARLPLITKKELPDDATQLLQKAFNYLHKEALTEYRAARKAEKDGAKITTLADVTLKYLYLVAISGEDMPAQNEAAYRYFLSKVGGELQKGTMMAKAQSAVIMQKAGRQAEANEFIASIKEHLVQTNEMGAYFAFHAQPYSWGMLPVPAHVEVMEALLRVGDNETLVEEMKLWLLKQKQVTSWNSPVATADAVYALLCQGSNLLENKGDVRITLGKKVLETLSPAKTIVPDLGYIKHTFTEGSPVLKAKSATVEKQDAGIAWGAVYAQYLSPISDVKQHGGELNVEKKLYVERVASNGEKRLQPVAADTQLAIGDKVVSRLTIRLDRAMDFVQLKDQRGACFEPIGSLSGYRWGDGLGYYVEIKDAATNFFFDHLGKGVYVLEYGYRIARGGTYETGLATIQSAYAPEYASHSAGGVVVIK